MSFGSKTLKLVSKKPGNFFSDTVEKKDLLQNLPTMFSILTLLILNLFINLECYPKLHYTK